MIKFFFGISFILFAIIIVNVGHAQSNYIFAGQIEEMNFYDIEPDVILNSHQTSNTQYSVDLNNDNNTDITFGVYFLVNPNMHFSHIKCWVNNMFNINTQNINMGNVVTPFELYDTINISSGYNWNSVGYFAHYPANIVGWVDEGPKYLGFRFGNNSLFRYGWFRVEVIQIDYDEFDLILYDYAYQPEITGIEEELFVKQVFPNPTSGALRIECSEIDNYIYSLLQINGRFISRGTFEGNETILSLQDLETGIYYLTINNQKGHTSCHKILKK